MNRYVAKISFLIMTVILISGFAFMQIENQISISAVDLSEFPEISFIIDPWDQSGNFLTSLEKEDILILENEHELDALEIEENNSGAQIVIAHNDGAAFTVSGEDEIPRSVILSDLLVDFFELLEPNAADSISIVTPDGILLTSQQDRNSIISAWESWEHDFTETLPNLNVLSLAIDLASDPAPQQGMGKTVLFLTPRIELDQAGILQDLADRAAQSRIRVHVGFIGRVADFDSEEAELLRNVAVQTGGQYFAYSLEEDIPDFNSMFEASRRAYKVTYHSLIDSAGENQLSVLIDSGSGNIQSEMEIFEIDVQAPNPIFLSLPGSIERYFPEDEEILLRNLEPTEYEIQVLVEFPDSHPRDIVQTSLYVNGEVAEQNREEPFDRFVLNIYDYQQEVRLILKVTAEDELGLVGESLDIPLTIRIKDPAHDIGEVFSSNITDLIIVVLVSMLGVGVLYLVLTGRIIPSMSIDRLYKRAKQINISDEDLESNKLSDKTRPRPFSRMRAVLSTEHTVIAELHMVDPETGRSKDRKYSITQDETILGSDINEAQIIFDDPSINGRHALIKHKADGGFRIMDLDTTAGTWLNYEQVSLKGADLGHGDLVFIGTVAFKFIIPGEGKDDEITVTYIE